MRKLDLARELIDRRHASAAPDAVSLNLKGLIEIASGNPSDAAAVFRRLHGDSSGHPSIRFNLAWSEALLGNYAEAADLLDNETLAASPRAPALKIQMLHHLERFEEALSAGSDLVARFPEDQALKGALAMLALDADEVATARYYAASAPDDSDASTVLALLDMEDGDIVAASQAFDAVLAAQPNAPRALIGKGLQLLSSGAAGEAAALLDRGAGLFEDHLGSWIAAGWAHFIAGDLSEARDRFQRAVAIDGTFAESYGGLAVLDLAEGRSQEAEQNCQIALRLDPACLGGILARTILLDARDEQTSQTACAGARSPLRSELTERRSVRHSRC